MKKPHYAWLICTGCALLLFCTSGLAVNAFSIYQPYIISINHFSNTQASAILTFRNCAGLISMFLADRYYQKLGIRNGLAVSGAVMALAFVLFGLASKYWQYCLASAITGIAYGMGTMIPIAILLNRWFRRSSDTAIGICSAVTGISTLGIPSLLSHSIDTSGLRLTFCAEAAVIGLLTLLCLCLLRNTPEEMGLLPYGAESEQSAETLRPPKEKDAQRHDLKCPELVIMIVMLILTGGVMNVSYSHLAVLITGEGLSESTAAISMSMSGLFLMLGKVAYGRLEDLWGTVRCNYVFAPIFLFGLALCSFIGTRPSLLYPAVVLYSFGISYMSVGISTWPAELSSAKRHSRLIQLFQIGYVSGSLVFSPLPGILADRSGGSYAGAFRLFLILGVIVFITVQTILIRHKKNRSPLKVGQGRDLQVLSVPFPSILHKKFLKYGKYSQNFLYRLNEKLPAQNCFAS